jgi:hypothetical protein
MILTPYPLNVPCPCVFTDDFNTISIKWSEQWFIVATGKLSCGVIEKAEDKSLLASIVNAATDVISDESNWRVEVAI